MRRDLLTIEGSVALETLPWKENGVTVSLVRLDKLHPHRGGNKHFKLKHNLAQALRERRDMVLTFGGAFSNHLRAAAAACSDLRLRLVCVVRGERSDPLNPVLQFVERLGGVLCFVSREDYRNKDNPLFIDSLLAQYGPAYVIPEGGANALGVVGCAEIPALLPSEFDVIACAGGTFTTMAGLVLGGSGAQHVIGVSVLKAEGYGERQVNALVEQARLQFSHLNAPVCLWRVADDYHFGGYAKRTKALDDFMNRMKTRCGVDTDFVYTAKLLYGVKDMISSGRIKANAKCAVLMSGPSAELAEVVFSNPPDSHP